MKFFPYIIPQILKLNHPLDDVQKSLCNRPWSIFNDEGLKILYIFQPDGSLLITTNGIVSISEWKYILANMSIIIASDSRSIMFHPTYIDKTLYVLQQDSEDLCLFMIDENNKDSFYPKNLTEIDAYFKQKEFIISQTKSGDYELTTEMVINKPHINTREEASKEQSVSAVQIVSVPYNSTAFQFDSNKYPEIKDRSTLAILCILFCGIITGVIALIFSSEAMRLYNRMKSSSSESECNSLYKKALSRDKTAEMWIQISLFIPVSFLLLFIFLRIIY